MHNTTTVTGRAWREGVCIDEDVTLDEAASFARDDGVLFWVDMLHPSQSDLETLAAKLDLAPTTIEDMVAPHERPKVIPHERTLFFTVYSAYLVERAREDEQRLDTGRVSGVLLPNGLITVRLDDGVDLTPVVARWQESPDLLELGPGALVHGLLDVIVDEHFVTIQSFDDEIEELEDVLFDDEPTGHDFVRRLYRFRKDLVALRRVVLPMREVVNALLRHRGRRGDALDHWYDDLYDHVLRASEWTESLRDLIASVFETNLSLQDSRLNIVMKKLAAWAAIIAIPTAITGWFGQNLPYPGFQRPLGLWFSLVSIVVVSGLLYTAFRRRDWL